MIKHDCKGMTLIEVLLASVILGLSMSVLLVRVAQSMRVYGLARRLQQVQWVLGRGEMEYPLYDASEPIEDLTVSADSSLEEGFTFSREVEEDEDEDGLYVVRTRVDWGDGDLQKEEIVQFIYHEE